VRRIATLVASLSAAAACAAAAVAAQSPTAVRNSIFAAANAQRSVHYVSYSKGRGKVAIVGDAWRTSGIQRIRYSYGHQSGHAKIVVANNTAYVHGDGLTLRSFIGFTKAQSARYANRWVRVPRQSHLYASIAEAVTLPSLLAEIYPKRNLERVSRTANGLPLVGVRGTTRHHGLPFIEAVYARGDGTPLPLTELEIAPTVGFRSSTALGRWNEKLRIAIPRHAVTIAGSGGTTA
jgi:hypothetical protein